jgi:hypothetical protein
MTLPGYTAEAALYRTKAHYYDSAGLGIPTKQVRPQATFMRQSTGSAGSLSWPWCCWWWCDCNASWVCTCWTWCGPCWIAGNTSIG